MNRGMARFYQMLRSGDARPARRAQAVTLESCPALSTALESWRRLNATDLPAINRMLGRFKLAPFAAVPVPSTPACGP